MATQKSSDPADPAEIPDEETRGVVEKAKAEARSALNRAKSERQARMKAEEALTQAREALSAVKAELEKERLQRLKFENALVESQNKLEIVQAELEQGRRVQATTMEQVRSEVEQTMPTAEREMSREALITERPAVQSGEKEGEQRASFVLRVAFNDQGQIKRTEIENVQTSAKEVFPAFDSARLASFVENYTRSALAPAVVPAEPVLVAAPAGPPEAKEIPGNAPRLIVSNVETLRLSPLQEKTLVLSPNQPFLVRVHFQFQDVDPSMSGHQPAGVQIKILVNDLINNKTELLTTEKTDILEGVFAYQRDFRTSGLPAGLYRLITLVTVQEHPRMASIHEGPVLRIDQVQQPFPSGPAGYPLTA